MTRWSLVADVWYLDPRAKKVTQTAVEFANDVKAEISATAQLKNLSWDGYFKVYKPNSKNFAPPAEKQHSLKLIPRKRYGAVVLERMQSKVDPRFYRRHSLDPSQFIRTTHTLKPEIPAPNHVEVSNEEDEHNRIKNDVLVALNDVDGRSRMIERISDKRNNVVTMWKRATRSRYSPEEEAHLETRRIEHSSWRIWFKHRQMQEEKARQELVETEEREIQEMAASVLHRVSSYMSTQRLFKEAQDLGDYFQGIGMAMNYNPDIVGPDRPGTPSRNSAASNGTLIDGVIPLSSY
jgi:hypothetical protein